MESPLPGPDIEGRGQDKIRLASRLVLPLMPRTAPAPPFCIAIAMHSMRRSSLFDYARKAYNTYSSRRAGKVYPHEIDIQETHAKHRKLDSQAALPHPTRGRAADGLRPQAWPLWASRCDHDPGGLPPWSAGLGGVRPAMAADRALRGPPPRSPGQERDSQRAPNPG